MSKNEYLNDTPTSVCRLIFEIAAFNADRKSRAVHVKKLNQYTENRFRKAENRKLISSVGDSSATDPEEVYLLTHGRVAVKEWLRRGTDGSESKIGPKWRGRVRLYFG